MFRSGCFLSVPEPHRERMGWERSQTHALSLGQAACGVGNTRPRLDGFCTLGLGKAVAENTEQNKLQKIEGMQEKS